MSVTIISDFAFRQMEDKLIQMSGALSHLSLMVCRVDSDIQSDSSLSKGVKETVEELLEKHITGISCILQALSNHATEMSSDAGD